MLYNSLNQISYNAKTSMLSRYVGSETSIFKSFLPTS